MKKALLGMACACMVIAILSPIVSYIYFSDRLSDASESYELQISEVQKENEKLSQENQQLKKENEEFKNPYLKEAFLATELGWYMHDSSDPVNYSRNKLTIYGDIYNIGATNAIDCKLIVTFHDNRTLLQQSEIDLGPIRYWSHTWVRKDIDCEMADNVTRIEVERTWTNMP